MQNRRDLLKLFGAGAVILPVVSGSIVESAAAQLIEVPKVELMERPLVNGAPLDMSRVHGITITFENEDGSRRTVRGDLTYGGSGSVGPWSDLTLDLRFTQASIASPSTSLIQGRIHARAVLL